MMDVYLHRNGNVELRRPLEIEGRYYTEAISSGGYTTREWMVMVTRANGNGVQVLKEVG